MFNPPVFLDECVLVFRGDDDSGWTAFVEHAGERVRLGPPIVPRTLAALARASAPGEWVSRDALAALLELPRVTLDIYIARARAALLRAGVADGHRVVEGVAGHRRLGVPSTRVRFESHPSEEQTFADG